MHFSIQEILDQIADIDLVVNFRSTAENLEKKNLGTGNLSPCQEYLGRSLAGSNTALNSHDEQQASSTTDSEGVLKERFDVYAEQVF